MQALQFEGDKQVWEGLSVLLQAVAGGVDMESPTCTHFLVSFFLLYLTVWGVEPAVTHQTSWLESTGVCGVQQGLSCTAEALEPRRCLLASTDVPERQPPAHAC